MQDGILLIDKPEGVTSRKVDNLIGKALHNRKVGHLGTLDPFATGLLVVGVGKGNKVLPFIEDGNKAYLASLKLGVATSTGDKDGEVTEQKEVPPFDIKKAKEVLATFLGKSKQIPPMTSAIKINGTALYELAHKGEEVEREPRDIEVFDIHPLYLEGDRLDFIATVSKGTYMRTLGEDIAKALGTVGHLTALRRLKVGNIGVERSTPLEGVSESSFVDMKTLISLPIVEIDEKVCKKAKNGMKLELNSQYDKVVLVYGDELIAVYEKQGNLYSSVRGLF